MDIVQLTVAGIDFDAAHIVSWHPKCKRLHGHTYNVEVKVEGEVDSLTSMVIDFGIVKDIASQTADMFDHRLLIDAQYVLEESKSIKVPRLLTIYDTDLEAVVPLPGEATVEVITHYFLQVFLRKLFSRVTSATYARIKAVTVTISEGNAKSASRRFETSPQKTVQTELPLEKPKAVR